MKFNVKNKLFKIKFEIKLEKNFKKKLINSFKKIILELIKAVIVALIVEVIMNRLFYLNTYGKIKKLQTI